MVFQLSLFGAGAPAIDESFSSCRRTELANGAWVEHQPGWLAGDAAVFDTLYSSTRWRTMQRNMYDRALAVPRLLATLPDDGPGHPLLDDIAAALSARYGLTLPSVSLALYRDERDSVSWHGDQLRRGGDDDPVVAIVSVGEPRRLLLRPRDGGPSLGWTLGWGDLFVMGGSCQETWLHAVPKSSRERGPRISVQFRPGRAEAPGERPTGHVRLVGSPQGSGHRRRRAGFAALRRAVGA